MAFLAVYVPTAFPDGVGEAWWLALEEVIARETRISLVKDNVEQRFDAATVSEKDQLYRFLKRWLRSLAPADDLSLAIRDLSTRYSVDLAALSRDEFMDWNDLNRLAADPLVTLGTATVNYPILPNLRDADALREMRMGGAVAQAASAGKSGTSRIHSAIAPPLAGGTSRWPRRQALPAQHRLSRVLWRRRGGPASTHCRAYHGTGGYVRLSHCG